MTPSNNNNKTSISSIFHRINPFSHSSKNSNTTNPIGSATHATTSGHPISPDSKNVTISSNVQTRYAPSVQQSPLASSGFNRNSAVAHPGSCEKTLLHKEVRQLYDCINIWEGEISKKYSTSSLEAQTVVSVFETAKQDLKILAKKIASSTQEQQKNLQKDLEDIQTRLHIKTSPKFFIDIHALLADQTVSQASAHPISTSNKPTPNEDELVLTEELVKLMVEPPLFNEEDLDNDPLYQQVQKLLQSNIDQNMKSQLHGLEAEILAKYVVGGCPSQTQKEEWKNRLGKILEGKTNAAAAAEELFLRFDRAQLPLDTLDSSSHIEKDPIYQKIEQLLDCLPPITKEQREDLILLQADIIRQYREGLPSPEQRSNWKDLLNEIVK